MKTNIYSFCVAGRLEVNKNLRTVYAENGDVIGFVLPDGRGVNPVVCFEIVDGTKFDSSRVSYATTDDQFEKLGISLEGYDNSVLSAMEGENPKCPKSEYVEV